MKLPNSIKEAAAGVYECEQQFPERKFDENGYKYRDFLAGVTWLFTHLSEKTHREFDYGNAYPDEIPTAFNNETDIETYETAFRNGAHSQHTLMLAKQMELEGFEEGYKHAREVVQELGAENDQLKALYKDSNECFISTQMECERLRAEAEQLRSALKFVTTWERWDERKDCPNIDKLLGETADE